MRTNTPHLLKEIAQLRAQLATNLHPALRYAYEGVLAQRVAALQQRGVAVPTA